MFNGNVRPTDLIIRADTKTTRLNKSTNFLIFLIEKMDHNAFEFQVSTLLLDFLLSQMLFLQFGGHCFLKYSTISAACDLEQNYLSCEAIWLQSVSEWFTEVENTNSRWAIASEDTFGWRSHPSLQATWVQPYLAGWLSPLCFPSPPILVRQLSYKSQ